MPFTCIAIAVIAVGAYTILRHRAGAMVTDDTRKAALLTNVSSAGTGCTYALALERESTVWGWGWNRQGRLDDDTTTDRLTPVPVTGLANVNAVSAGRFEDLDDGHNLAVKGTGTVWI